MTADRTPRVAWLGLGQMGLPMAARLVSAGVEVRSFDPNAEARRAFEDDHGGRASGSASDAVGDAELVVLMLPSSAVVEQALVGGGVLDRLAARRDGTGRPLLLDMGSSEPMATRGLAGRAAEQGIAFVDAPVSGGVSGAQAGTLTIMAGGVTADVARVEPLLAHLGETIVHVGPVGAGHAIKALNNLLSATHLLASSEVLRIARAFDLDPETLLEAINGSSGKSWSTELKLPRYIVPETYDSGFRLALLAKDVDIAVGLAGHLGVRSLLAHSVQELWSRAGEALEVGADHTEIYRWVEGGEREISTADAPDGEGRAPVVRPAA